MNAVPNCGGEFLATEDVQSFVSPGKDTPKDFPFCNDCNDILHVEQYYVIFDKFENCSLSDFQQYYCGQLWV